MNPAIGLVPVGFEARDDLLLLNAVEGDCLQNYGFAADLGNVVFQLLQWADMVVVSGSRQTPFCSKRRRYLSRRHSAIRLARAPRSLALPAGRETACQSAFKFCMPNHDFPSVRRSLRLNVPVGREKLSMAR